MIINYVLIVVCALYGIGGLIIWRKGGSRVRPLSIIIALILLVLVVIATIKGMTYYDFRAMIEGKPY